MTKADLVEIVYEKVGGLSKKESQDIVETIFDTMKDILKNGKRSRSPVSETSSCGTSVRGRGEIPRPATTSRSRRAACSPFGPARF